MKTFKIIDFWVQASVVIAGTVIAITDPDNFYVAYFLVGAFQLASMLIHEVAQSGTAKGTARRVYHNITYIFVIAMVSSPFLYPLLFIFLPLLFFAPVMALYYLRLCYKESFIITKGLYPFLNSSINPEPS